MNIFFKIFNCTSENILSEEFVGKKFFLFFRRKREETLFYPGRERQVARSRRSCSVTDEGFCRSRFTHGCTYNRELRAMADGRYHYPDPHLHCH